MEPFLPMPPRVAAALTVTGLALLAACGNQAAPALPGHAPAATPAAMATDPGVTPEVGVPPTAQVHPAPAGETAGPVEVDSSTGDEGRGIDAIVERTEHAADSTFDEPLGGDGGIRELRLRIERARAGMSPKIAVLFDNAVAAHLAADRRRLAGADADDFWRAELDALETLADRSPRELILDTARKAFGYVGPFDEAALTEAAVIARIAPNESAAIATLKNISSAQAQTQASGVIDHNGNGAGEYGTFGEMSGRVAIRGSVTAENPDGRRMTPPVLSSAFGNVQNGQVVRSGYVFQAFLPRGAGGHFVAEAPTGGIRGNDVDHSLCEVVWRAYAWPVEYGRSGKRAFMVSQNGDVLACDNPRRWSGVGNGPRADAASGVDLWSVATNAYSITGDRWTVIH